MGEFWWRPAQACLGVAFEEAAQARHQALAELDAVLSSPPWHGQPRVERARRKRREIAGAQGDFAQWVWAFEMDEAERELLRGLPLERRFELLEIHGVELLGGMCLNFEFFGSSPASARLRRMGRAMALGRDLDRMEPEDEPPFAWAPRGIVQRMVAKTAWAHWRAASALARVAPLALWVSGVAACAAFAFGGALAGLSALTMLGVGVGAVWLGLSDKSPWRRLLEARLRRAYPDLNAEGFFVSGRGDNLEQQRPAMKRAIDAVALGLATQPTAEPEILLVALDGDGSEAWPSLALRATIEDEVLGRAALTPSRTKATSRL